MPLAESIWKILRSAYASPPRAYHSLHHVAELLEHFEWVQAEHGWSQPNEVECAIAFHDAVYVAGAKDNEARSADLARHTLRGSTIDCERVAWLILLTARHGHDPRSSGVAETDVDALHFLDADMAILGSSAERFAGYHRAIAEEYRAQLNPLVFATTFQIGRRRFLERLLAGKRIYHTPLFHDRFDAAARRNLKWALAD